MEAWCGLLISRLTNGSSENVKSLSQLREELQARGGSRSVGLFLWKLYKSTDYVLRVLATRRKGAQ